MGGRLFIRIESALTLKVSRQASHIASFLCFHMLFFECRLCVQSGAKVNVKTLHCTPKTTLSDVLRWQQGEAGGIIFLFLFKLSLLSELWCISDEFSFQFMCRYWARALPDGRYQRDFCLLDK
jgi:hypothetical protein